MSHRAVAVSSSLVSVIAVLGIAAGAHSATGQAADGLPISGKSSTPIALACKYTISITGELVHCGEKVGFDLYKSPFPKFCPDQWTFGGEFPYVPYWSSYDAWAAANPCPPECTADADCAGGVCDLSTDTCVECVSVSDCGFEPGCGSCVDNACVETGGPGCKL